LYSITHKGQGYTLRLATDSDVPAIRTLVNIAYGELADMGLHFVGATQDENVTRERMAQGKTFVLTLDETIVATILLFSKNYFTQKNTAYIGQFAVNPAIKKQGLGSILMDHCERLAQIEGFEGIQLDTAIPAEHLVRWYKNRGYVEVGEIHVDGRNYNSLVLERIFTDIVEPS
jgi:predicted N-acetyltransferase YhbS